MLKDVIEQSQAYISNVVAKKHEEQERKRMEEEEQKAKEGA